MGHQRPEHYKLLVHQRSLRPQRYGQFLADT